MSMRSSQILDEILSLSPHERAELVDQILASFDVGPDQFTTEKWSVEAELRIDAIENGELNTNPAEEVFARLRRRAES